jgi:hypothetical protein
MRVVVDTNTLASGALAFTGSPAGSILDAWRDGAFILVVSEDILAELASTLAKPYFAARISADNVAALLDLIAGTATLIDVPGDIVGIASHPEDDLILECSVVAEAAYLVTGDKMLQRLKEFKGIKIVSPREFLDTLRQLP